MLYSRWLLPFLAALYLLLEELSAAVLPSRLRNKREISWLDQEVFSRLFDPSDVSDLSVGDAGETGRDEDSRPFHSQTFVTPTEHLSAQQQHLNQHQYNRKANEKRRKVAPLDTIGGFQMSGFRKQKDEPGTYRDDYLN